MDKITENTSNNQMINSNNSLPLANNNNHLLTQDKIKEPEEGQAQKASEAQEEIIQIEEGKEFDINIPKKVRKRATKNESDIRNYKCTLCDKSYLSYPALYTHCKQKHNTNTLSGRGRGRPKKENNETGSEKIINDPMDETYFQTEERGGSTSAEKIDECIHKAFNYLYQNDKNEEIIKKIKDGKMKKYPNIESHPFLGKFLLVGHDVNKFIGNYKIPTDEVLMNYLDKMSVYCKEEYFVKLIIFVTLFRENINYINKDQAEKEHEYSEIKEAEDIPELSNEFITDFLLPDDQDYVFVFTKEEIIDLTRNLCNWMYKNNFTCSRLILIDKEKE